jgi:hypothetical protein
MILNKNVLRICSLSDEWFCTLSSAINFVFCLAVILGDLHRMLKIGFNLGVANSDLLVVIGLIKRDHIKYSCCTGRLNNELQSYANVRICSGIAYFYLV